jgi:hypothetical protein
MEKHHNNVAGGTADSSKGCSLNSFIRSAAAILAITGITKVWAAFGDVKLLTVADPIVGIQFGHLMFAVGLAEIVIALVCFFSKRHTLALALVAWLATNFVVYRLDVSWVGWKKPCSCLGNRTDGTGLQSGTNLSKNRKKKNAAPVIIHEIKVKK